MDPLSDVLSLVRPNNYASGGLVGGGRWAFEFPAHGGIKCYAIMKGECFVAIDGVKKPAHLRTGDCLMLPHGRSFRLCSDLGARPRDARTLFSGPVDRYNGFRSIAPGDDFTLIGGHFALEGNAELLLRVLPPFVHLRKGAEEPSLRGHLEQLMEEMKNPQPGGFLLARQSAYSMLVLVLRMYLARGERGGIGWLFALANPRIARAITTMHEKPGHDWTVQTLAEQAGMSRTTFAEHFRRTVGDSPMEYLTRWRMLIAGERLLHSNASVFEIAGTVGYESESAFSAAFKRTMGESPRAYARRRRA
jgi:AraC-like DNA-binding protein